MEKLNVLHVFPTLLPGGAEKLVLYLLENCDREKLSPAILVIKNKQNSIIEEELEKIGIPVFYANKCKGIDLALGYKINRIIANFKPQVIHTHLDVLKYIFWPTILQRIPVRIHTVHSLAEKEINSTSRKINKVAYKYFNFTPIAISKTVMKSIEKVYKLEGFPLIYNGIEIKKYRQFDLKRNKNFIQLINVARFEEAKNHDLLIDVFKTVALHCPNVYLKLVGDGPLKERIKEKVCKLNLKDRVEFLGIRDDVPYLLAESDIFVFSSKWEGLPLAVLEAIASGLPIVSTDIESIAEIITDRKNGFLIKSNDAQEFSKVLIELIRNNELRVTIGKEGSRLVQNYDINNTKDSYERLYMDLLNKYKGCRKN